MYRNIKEFWADYRSVSNYYKEFTRNIQWMGEPDVNRAYNIYLQARQQRYGTLVMGRTCVDEAGRTPAQFGNAITTQEHQALGVITHNDEAPAVLAGQAGITNMNVATGGMIMHFYNNINSAWRNNLSGYHFLYNDAWLLGGAHGLCDFNLASPRRKSNLWDVPGSRLTATGREVVFLDSCGYRIAKTGHDGYEVYTSKNDANAKSARFQTLVAAMRSVRSDGSTIDKLSV